MGGARNVIWHDAIAKIMHVYYTHKLYHIVRLEDARTNNNKYTSSIR